MNARVELPAMREVRPPTFRRLPLHRTLTMPWWTGKRSPTATCLRCIKPFDGCPVVQGA